MTDVAKICGTCGHCRLDPFDPDLGVCTKAGNDDLPTKRLLRCLDRTRMAVWWHCRYWKPRNRVGDLLSSPRVLAFRMAWYGLKLRLRRWAR